MRFRVRGIDAKQAVVAIDLQAQSEAFAIDAARKVGLSVLSVQALGLALPLVVAHAVLVVEGAAWLLAAWVPEPVLAWLGAVYLASLALGVGALYGIIPLAVAWRRRSTVESV